MTQLEARCWSATLRALYWMVQAMIADRIGPNCRQPNPEGVFKALAGAEMQVETECKKGG